MNGDSFRKTPPDVVQAFESVGICPDCDSSMQLRQVSEFMFVLEVTHSDSCPWLRRVEEGQGA